MSRIAAYGGLCRLILIFAFKVKDKEEIAL